MEVEADNRTEGFGWRHVDRRRTWPGAARQHRIQRCARGRVDQHRLHAVPMVLQEPLDDESAFGDEEPARPHEFAVTDSAVVGNPSIARVGHRYIVHRRVRYHWPR